MKAVLTEQTRTIVEVNSGIGECYAFVTELPQPTVGAELFVMKTSESIDSRKDPGHSEVV